jgi:hypothetical protein
VNCFYSRKPCVILVCAILPACQVWFPLTFYTAGIFETVALERPLLIEVKRASPVVALVRLLANQPQAVEAWERVMRQAGRAYKEDCAWRLNTEEVQDKAPGPGGQRTVQVSKERENLLAVSCTSLDVVLTEIEDGKEGMTKRVREMDSVRPGRGVPFSRFYGRHTSWEATGLRLQLRDFSVPLLAAASGTAEGDMIFAQQVSPSWIVALCCPRGGSRF